MTSRRINEIMEHTTVPTEKWKQCWANYAGATSEDNNPYPKDSKQRGKRWRTASNNALDEIRKQLDADTWRHRHSEEKEKLREEVRQVEQHRRMDGSVICPKCGGHFNQLASHIQFCKGNQRTKKQEGQTQHTHTMLGMPTVENGHETTSTALLQRKSINTDGSNGNASKRSMLINTEPTTQNTRKKEDTQHRGKANDGQDHDLQTQPEATQRQAETDGERQRNNSEDDGGLQRI